MGELRETADSLTRALQLRMEQGEKFVMRPNPGVVLHPDFKVVEDLGGFEIPYGRQGKGSPSVMGEIAITRFRAEENRSGDLGRLFAIGQTRGQEEVATYGFQILPDLMQNIAIHLGRNDLIR